MRTVSARTRGRNVGKGIARSARTGGGNLQRAAAARRKGAVKRKGTGRNRTVRAPKRRGTVRVTKRKASGRKRR